MSENFNDSRYLLGANLYVKQLYTIFISDIHSKKPDYSLILNGMLKSRDFMLYAKGARQYRNFKDVTWKTIQQNLDDGEYCMEHFESHTVSGMLYALWDRTSRRRNYAFVFNNSMDKPHLWHRGYIDNIESQGFDRVLDDYPDCTTVYSTGTDYMSLKDFVRNNSKVHRCHSLSKIKDNKKLNTDDFAFIGLIDFGNNAGEVGVANTKGHVRNNKLYNFPTDKILYAGLDSLGFANFNPITGHVVDKFRLVESLKTGKLIHISSHGIFQNSDLIRMNEEAFGIDVINGNNILKNCKLILSGYNENNDNYISGDEIQSLDLSNIDLLFLDACQTGDGRHIGAGSYSLSEAFHLAGVKNIIATLDPIDPNITCEFSLRFYSLLNQGISIHDAFYLAKSNVCPNERIILWE